MPDLPPITVPLQFLYGAIIWLHPYFSNEAVRSWGDPGAYHGTCSCSVTVVEGRNGARGWISQDTSKSRGALISPGRASSLLPFPCPTHRISFPMKIIILPCKLPRDLFWTHYILTYNSVRSQSIRKTRLRKSFAASWRTVSRKQLYLGDLLKLTL